MSNLFIAAAIVFALAGMVFAIALCKSANDEINKPDKKP
jgi:hypothetical protein